MNTEQTPATPGHSLRTAIGEAARLARPMAWLALFTVLLAQGIAPALKGVALGLGRIINAVDLVAGASSHMLALAASAVCIGLLLLLARDKRTPLPIRALIIAQTSLVLILAVPASRFRLSPMACFFLGIVACAVAATGSIEAVREPRSRAAGIVLGLIALAAASRIVAAGLLALLLPERAVTHATTAAVLATLSLLLHAMAMFVALAWLASRKRTVVSLGSLAALVCALVLVGFWQAGLQPNASAGTIFVARLVDSLTPAPHSLLPRVTASFITCLGVSVAMIALLARRQMATVVAALSLTLTAGTRIDVPGHALILTLATLVAALAARDEHGMWESLVGHRLSAAPVSKGAPGDSAPP